MADRVISELERRYITEAIIQALTEIDASEDFSQGVVDDLEEGLKILGVRKNAEGEYVDHTRG
jgi:hypothetical protein